MTPNMLRHVLMISALIPLLGLNACSGVAGKISHTMTWEEEILLNDGQVVVAKRFYTLGGHPTLDSRERTAVNQTVTFNLPGKNQSITWQTDFRDSVPEANSLNLLLFDVVKGVPYIATYPAGCIAYNKWKRPNPPYVLFRYEGGEWHRISLSEFPAALTKANVIVGRPPSELLKPYYRVEDVRSRNYYLQPEYKTVVREALPQERINEMCEERIFYKGHWVLPNDPVARKIIDQREKLGNTVINSGDKK